MSTKSEDKRQAILEFTKAFIARNQYPPTYEEIRAGCGLSSKSLVDYHLNILEAAGKLTRGNNIIRSIVLVEAA